MSLVVIDPFAPVPIHIPRFTIRDVKVPLEKVNSVTQEHAAKQVFLGSVKLYSFFVETECAKGEDGPKRVEVANRVVSAVVHGKTLPHSSSNDTHFRVTSLSCLTRFGS